jgi:hypothetical protein
VSPRDKLQKRADFKQIASFLNSPEMDLCSEVAMLTMIEQHLPSSADHLNAAAYHYRLDGAKIFLRTLRGLASLTPERRPDTSGQLRHDV